MPSKAQYSAVSRTAMYSCTMHYPALNFRISPLPLRAFILNLILT